MVQCCHSTPGDRRKSNTPLCCRSDAIENRESPVVAAGATCADRDLRPSDDLLWRTVMICPMRLSSWRSASNSRACSADACSAVTCRFMGCPDCCLVLPIGSGTARRPASASRERSQGRIHRPASQEAWCQAATAAAQQISSSRTAARQAGADRSAAYLQVNGRINRRPIPRYVCSSG